MHRGMRRSRGTSIGLRASAAPDALLRAGRSTDPDGLFAASPDTAADFTQL
jgi:hypothetical protein